MDSTTTETISKTISISEESFPGLKLTTDVLSITSEQELILFLIQQYEKNFFHEINEYRNKILYDKMNNLPLYATQTQLFEALEDTQKQELVMMKSRIENILNEPIKYIPISLPRKFEYLLNEKQTDLLKHSKLQVRYLNNKVKDGEKTLNLYVDEDNSTTIINLEEGINIYIDKKAIYIPPRSILSYAKSNGILKFTIKQRKTYSFNKDPDTDGFIVKTKGFGYKNRNSQHMIIINEKPL